MAPPLINSSFPPDMKTQDKLQAIVKTTMYNKSEFQSQILIFLHQEVQKLF